MGFWTRVGAVRNVRAVREPSLRVGLIGGVGPDVRAVPSLSSDRVARAVHEPPLRWVDWCGWVM